MLKTKLKICGIRSYEELEELKEMDIDYFGCIFAPKSPRFVSNELAKKNIKLAHEYNKKVVGVFVNRTVDDIYETIIETNIDVVQLHSNESVEFVEKLYDKLNKNKNLEFSGKKIKIWKVFSVEDKLPIFDDFKPYIEYVLFDTKTDNYGGSGKTFNWEILKNVDFPFILAGGLSNENIKEALKYNPVILDVNSKVETKDRKDKNLILEIIDIVK